MHTHYLLADLAVLNTMAEDTCLEIMPAMIQVYCDELSKRRDLLNAASIRCDFHEINEQAHAIKSSSGTFGAQRLRQCAKLLETSTNEISCNPREIATLVNEVQSVLADTTDEYRLCMSKFA